MDSLAVNPALGSSLNNPLVGIKMTTNLDPAFELPETNQSILDLFEICTYLTFPQIAKNFELSRHYLDKVSVPGKRNVGRTFRHKCNLDTTHHLDELADRQLIVADRSGKDFGFVKPVYDYAYYDSALGNQIETAHLAQMMLNDWDRLRRTRETLYVRPDVAKLGDAYHRGGGRSEFHSSQLLLSSIYLRVLHSSDAIERSLVSSWRPIPLPEQVESYGETYVGDAQISLDGETIALCSPFIPNFWRGVEAVQAFLVGLQDRMKERRYWLFSPHGFGRLGKQLGVLR